MSLGVWGAGLGGTWWLTPSRRHILPSDDVDSAVFFSNSAAVVLSATALPVVCETLTVPRGMGSREGHMSDGVQSSTNKPVRRRTIAKGMAWSVPAIAVAAPARAAAASIRKDPGINGWMQASYPRNGCTYTWDTTSNGTGSTPDGVPWGLFVYDVEDDNVITNATLTFWFIGTQSSISWSTRTGHNNCWSTPVPVGTEVKPDGYSYSGYRSTWSATGACANNLDPANRVTGADGLERLFLGHFAMRAVITQTGDYCGSNRHNLTWWGQRSITIDPDGPGSLPPVVHTFQRRAGTMGAYTGALSQQRSTVSTDEERVSATY